jgi:hypothetical protein
MRLRIVASVVVSVAALPSPAAAQQAAVGRLEGTLVASRDAAPPRAAWVSMVRLDPEGGVTFNAKPDDRGRFAVESLPAGRYLVQVGTATLDSLDVALPPSELRIQGGQTSRAEFALPAGARLRDAICQGLKLPQGKVAVAGRATDADTDRPIAAASIIAAWTALVFDSAHVRVLPEQRVATVLTDEQGDFRLCGVPSDRPLFLPVQHAGRASAVVRIEVSEAQGASVQHLSLSGTTAPTIAALDSVARLTTGGPDSARPELALTGTARLRGVVLGAGDRPLAGAEVHVRDAAAWAETDSAGRYGLDALPAGTQVLVVRQLGYTFAELPVGLRPGQTTTRDVALERVSRLDTMQVRAQRPAYAEFEQHRRTNQLGKFLSLSQLQVYKGRQTSDLVGLLGDFVVVGSGPRARVVSRSMWQNRKCTSANIVIDRNEGMSINDVQPEAIAGMEGYSDPSTAPAAYGGRADCGLIVIWLRTVGDRQRRFKDSSPLKYNGYP